MTEDTEPIVLICAPVAWRSETRIPGTAQRECEDCGQPIWVAPSGQRILQNPNARAVCTPCGQVALEEPDTSLDRPTDDQMKEVRDTFLREML